MTPPPMLPPVFLVGMPGSGKSTLGKALALATGRQFIDLDLYIQGRFSCSISDIFARRGEESFRNIESNLLREVGEMTDVVVATGGGTPCHHGNMEYMNSRGLTLWLQPTPARLHERLCRGRAKRPVLAALDDKGIAEYIRVTSRVRSPFYSMAAHTVESTLLEDHTQIHDTVQRCLQLPFPKNKNTQEYD